MPSLKKTGVAAAPTRPGSSRIQAAAAKRKADEATLEAQQAATKRRKTANPPKNRKLKTPATRISSNRAASSSAAPKKAKTVTSTSTKSAKIANKKRNSSKIAPIAAQKGSATKKSSQKKTNPKPSKKNTAKAKAPSNGVQKNNQASDTKISLAKKRQAAAAKAWATRRANAAKAAAAAAQAGTSGTALPAASTHTAKAAKALPIINHAPTQVLDVFVCGSGENGELGLGTGTNPSTTNVRRPRLHPFLAADRVGVVQIATGGMHCAALTKDGKILTWGVNDDGALGRGSTVPTPAMLDAADNNPNHNGLNANECVPMEIPADRFPPGTVITKLAAGDSITLALTAEGHVYGWGVFRDNNGVFAFSREAQGKQWWPARIEGLKNIIDIACGDNHCLALTATGKVFSWGAYEQSQLGRRFVQRHRLSALRPSEFGLGRLAVKQIYAGSYHSFAVDSTNRVWAWGLNNCGQTGVPAGAGQDGAVVQPPARVTALAGRSVVCMSGGSHHTIALDAGGEVLTWGKADGCQLGVALTGGALDPNDTLPNSRGHVGVVLTPQIVRDVGTASWVTCGTDHNIALTPAGRAYAWGLATSHQTGLGQADEDVDRPELVDNSAVRGHELTWAGAGGQFTVFASHAAQSGV